MTYSLNSINLDGNYRQRSHLAQKSDLSFCTYITPQSINDSYIELVFKLFLRPVRQPLTVMETRLATLGRNQHPHPHPSCLIQTSASQNRL